METMIIYHGVGRRKAAVARVWLRRGNGAVVVNGKSYADYFDTEFNRKEVEFPLSVTNHTKTVDVNVIVNGGGRTGQAQAIKLGIARALFKSQETLKAELKKYSLLTVDSRVKERKKYGQKGARKKFQFVKR